MICEVCSGRGWVAGRRYPAEQCGFCGGKGELSWGAVAKKLDEHPSTLARLHQLRSRSATARRVLDKVCKVLWPRGQVEMFS